MKNKKTNKTEKKKMMRTTLRFETDFHKKLKILAIEEGVSMTDLVKNAIEELMKKKRGK
jgi:predicted DNA-binding ribbon-helix-helix protein